MAMRLNLCFPVTIAEVVGVDDPYKPAVGLKEPEIKLSVSQRDGKEFTSRSCKKIFPKFYLKQLGKDRFNLIAIYKGAYGTKRRGMLQLKLNSKGKSHENDKATYAKLEKRGVPVQK